MAKESGVQLESPDCLASPHVVPVRQIIRNVVLQSKNMQSHPKVTNVTSKCCSSAACCLPVCAAFLEADTHLVTAVKLDDSLALQPESCHALILR